MGRLAWSQVRFRPARALALIVGVLVAATAFTVLTAASRTAQARTVGKVSANFQPAYDILVRPKGSRSAVESTTGTVEPDFQSGIYGGITMAQWHQIERIPGVQVAAPIAMVGYTELNAYVFVPVPAAALKGSGPQLYRISTTWVSDNGAARVAQPPAYLYVTPLPLSRTANNGAANGTGPGCQAPSVLSPETNPFGSAAQSYVQCWSRVNQYDMPAPGPRSRNSAGYFVTWTVPVLIAAIDPDAEAKLDGLNKALVSGSYLTENESARSPTLPVLASSASGMNEYAQTTVAQLAAPSAMRDMNAAWESAQASVPGRTVATGRTTAQQAYSALINGPPTDYEGTAAGDFVEGYWSVGPVDYQRITAGVLKPRQVVNPPSVWYTGTLSSVAMDDEESQYRTVTSHLTAQSILPGGYSIALIKIAGVFDPARMRAFDRLSQVPLGDYQPVTAAPANAASSRALRGGDLLPSQNVGGLVSQPVNLITTLAALPGLENGHGYTGVPAADPISVIRVRVAGVTGAGALSRERINAVAQQIEQRTGLDVDVVAGSSPSPVTIDVPAGKFGQPPLTLSQNWVKEGVALAILKAVDKTSVALYVLILVVCGLFVANAATAAVRGRRRELGVLAAVGWRRSRLFTTILGELAAIGLGAGLLAAAVAVPISSALGLDPSPARAMLAVPVAIAVALAGGLAPAWLAARADPVASIRPPVLATGRAHHPRGITSLALLNVARTPGRTAIGVISLAVGIAALTMLTAVTFAFRGIIVGSLLGDAVAVQVRSVDYIAAGATIILGVLAVADVMFLNITERAAELATIRSFGWRDAALARLVITEGAIIGIAGSLTGAAFGLAAAAWFAGQLPARLLAIAAAAVAAGIVVTVTAALLPAALLRRLPAAHLLAEE
ncbi:MAG TPA: FtsX-like permease family protein [Streptosporangiaceae bacterium]|nr:FtsX-like permease family protein [Streptosporangiaceae bacterium]